MDGRRAADGARRLSVDFGAWFGGQRSLADHFQQGLIVLDANALLDLYRIAPQVRQQVLETLAHVVSRLWVPHQVALEFSRNRMQVVHDRVSEVRKTKLALKAAAGDALDLLEGAVTRLLDLRDRAHTTRQWEPSAFGLDRTSLSVRLAGAMDAALRELADLESEHDLHPKDLQSKDPVLDQIDSLLDGRIGAAYSSAELRDLVQEAIGFRYPNQIPPGFLDNGKPTPVRQAGDYLVWRQVLDKVADQQDAHRQVLLITNDVKADWWQLDKNGRPVGPRPELVQEMRDVSRADLALLTLKGFMEGAKVHLASTVSDRTLEALEQITDDRAGLLPAVFRNDGRPPNLLELDHRAFERLVHYLLIRMGYDVTSERESADYGVDFRLADPETPGRKIVVEVKRFRGLVSAEVIHQLRGVIEYSGATEGIVITTSSFTRSAQTVGEAGNISLIDGAMLLRLLEEHGIRATIKYDDDN